MAYSKQQEDRLRAEMNRHPSGSPAYNAARLKLNDYRRASGMHTNADVVQPRTPGAGGKVVSDNVKLDKGGQVINTQFKVSDEAVKRGNLLANPNQVTDFGTQNVMIDPKTGQPTVTSTITGANKDVLSGIQGNSVLSSEALKNLFMSGAFGNLSGTAAPGAAKMSTFEQAIFDKLTSGVHDEENQRREQLAQELVNRGIPPGSALFDDQMSKFRTDFGKRYDNARLDAVTQGTNATFQAVPTLSSAAGAGFYMPSFQGFTSTPYNQPDITSIFSTLKEAEASKNALSSSEKIAAMNAKVAAANRGGGAPAKTPFNPGPPPGSQG